MNYFCDALIQSKKDQKKRLFIVLEQTGEDIPVLTKEKLLRVVQYTEFVQTYKPRLTMVDYTVYSTASDVYASMQDEQFLKLIADGNAKKLASSELQIGRRSDTNTVRKKKALSPVGIALMIGCILIVGIGSFGLGKMLGRSGAVQEEADHAAAPDKDGLLIPEQAQIMDDAEQITVTIDRSYAAIPTEDLQLKGAIVDGSAQITLPEFDKTDFFTHVEGYTWGFTSDPDGDKIEYYGGATYSFSADTKLYRVLVKYGGGSGTKEDPYLIDYYDQLELMAKEKARGYFRQTADIVFPSYASHQSINTVNQLKLDPDAEYFEYDGNGYLISNLDNALFGKISGAVIKNVNIQNSFIYTERYADCGFIAKNVYNYQYEAEDGTMYETGETLIQHCSVSHSAIYFQHPEEYAEVVTEIVTAPVVVPPDVVEYDENGDPIEQPTDPPEPQITKTGQNAVGAITGIGGQIEDCYVTDFGIYAYLEDYILFAGGLSGKPANVVDSAVYYFSVQGNVFSAGGLVGSCGGARKYDAQGKELPAYYGGNIQGSTAGNIILNTELAAGGIAGEEATNANAPLISNCYASDLQFSCGVFSDMDRETVVKKGATGGIIGMDGSDGNGHVITNSVSPDAFPVIGGKAASSYDDTVRIAPSYAFYQENILSVINRNTVSEKEPDEIFTGSFTFGNGELSDGTGQLAYPEKIKDLFEKTVVREDSNE